MEWQFNWRVWHWPWKDCTTEWYYYPREHQYNFTYISCFAGFGPFQFHWNKGYPYTADR